MLEMWFAIGDIRAFEYTLIDEALFDPSEGVTLRFGRQRVIIKGQRLRPHFGGIVRHAVRWICEAERNQAFGIAENDPIAESIRVVEEP
jgi:hypothetical protein